MIDDASMMCDSESSGDTGAGHAREARKAGGSHADGLSIPRGGTEPYFQRAGNTVLSYFLLGAASTVTPVGLSDGHYRKLVMPTPPVISHGHRLMSTCHFTRITTRSPFTFTVCIGSFDASDIPFSVNLSDSTWSPPDRLVSICLG
jgi:hypothetical protein